MNSELNWKWRSIEVWCPVCWWRQTSDFYFTVAESAIRRAMKHAHKRAKPNCASPLRFEKIYVAGIEASFSSKTN